MVSELFEQERGYRSNRQEYEEDKNTKGGESNAIAKNREVGKEINK